MALDWLFLLIIKCSEMNPSNITVKVVTEENNCYYISIVIVYVWLGLVMVLGVDGPEGVLPSSTPFTL